MSKKEIMQGRLSIGFYESCNDYYEIITKYYEREAGTKQYEDTAFYHVKSLIRSKNDCIFIIFTALSIMVSV